MPPAAVESPATTRPRRPTQAISAHDMLESLKQFLADLAGGTKPQHHFQDGDYRLAAAALLIHVSTIDGEASPAERNKLHSVLKNGFNLDDDLSTRDLGDGRLVRDRGGARPGICRTRPRGRGGGAARAATCGGRRCHRGVGSQE